jgi:hypothetical protein
MLVRRMLNRKKGWMGVPAKVYWRMASAARLSGFTDTTLTKNAGRYILMVSMG